MIYFLIYLVTIVDSIKAALEVAAAITLTVGGVIALFNALELFVNGNPNAKKMIPKIARNLFIAGIIALGVNAFTPTTKQLALIAGGGLAFEAMTSDTAKGIANEILSSAFKDDASQLIEAVKNQ